MDSSDLPTHQADPAGTEPNYDDTGDLSGNPFDDSSSSPDDDLVAELFDSFKDDPEFEDYTEFRRDHVSNRDRASNRDHTSRRNPGASSLPLRTTAGPSNYRQTPPSQRLVCFRCQNVGHLSCRTCRGTGKIFCPACTGWETMPPNRTVPCTNQ
jgi:hypothetical protein